MSVDYTPTMKPYEKVGAFRYWCQTTMPLVYDDSKSYLELLYSVIHYLNSTISDVANMGDNIDALLEAYNQLQKYVNDYFDNLDVQEEINAKLDEMATDGTLDNLLEPFVQTFVGDWLEEHLTPTTPPIDKTLTIENAGADAKVVGEKFNTLNETLNLNYIYNDLWQISGDLVESMLPDLDTIEGFSKIFHFVPTAEARPLNLPDDAVNGEYYCIMQFGAGRPIGGSTVQILVNPYKMWVRFRKSYTEWFGWELITNSETVIFNLQAPLLNPTTHAQYLTDLNDVFAERSFYEFVVTSKDQILHVPDECVNEYTTLFVYKALGSPTIAGTLQLLIISDHEGTVKWRYGESTQTWGAWHTVKCVSKNRVGVFKNYLGHIFNAKDYKVKRVITNTASPIHVTGTNLLNRYEYATGYYDSNGYHQSADWKIFIIPNWKHGKFRVSGFPTVSGAYSAYLNSYNVEDFGKLSLRSDYINRKWGETENYPFIALCAYLPSYDPGTQLTGAMVTYEADRAMPYESYNGDIYNSVSDIVLRPGVNNIWTEDATVVSFEYYIDPEIDTRINVDVYTVGELIDAIIRSKKQRMNIYIHGGDYDILAGMAERETLTGLNGIVNSDGLWLGNGVYITSDPGVRLIANYSGDWPYISNGFSIFNSHGDEGYTLEGLNFVGSNIRYIIHDDPTDYEECYKNVYKNCHFYLDNQNNPNWNSNCAIGGGLAKSSIIQVEGCIFEIPEGSTKSLSLMLSYHNSKHPEAQSIVNYIGNVFLNCKCGVSWYGTSTRKTKVIINNNHMPVDYDYVAETPEYQGNNNMTVYAWNNVISNS